MPTREEMLPKEARHQGSCWAVVIGLIAVTILGVLLYQNRSYANGLSSELTVTQTELAEAQETIKNLRAEVEKAKFTFYYDPLTEPEYTGRSRQ